MICISWSIILYSRQILAFLWSVNEKKYHLFAMSLSKCFSIRTSVLVVPCKCKRCYIYAIKFLKNVIYPLVDISHTSWPFFLELCLLQVGRRHLFVVKLKHLDYCLHLLPLSSNLQCSERQGNFSDLRKICTSYVNFKANVKSHKKKST